MLPHALVPQHLVAGSQRRRRQPAPRRNRARPVRRASREARATDRLHVRRRRRRAAVLRERDQRPRVCTACRRARPFQGRHPRVRRPRRPRAPSIPSSTGTKAAAHYRCDGAGRAATRRRACVLQPATGALARSTSSTTSFDARRHEADEFYARAASPTSTDADERRVQRQAFAGMLWSKQFYHYDVARWLARRPGTAAAAARAAAAAATATGGTSTTPTSSRCPTSGSTPGSRRGTWRSTACRWRWSTPSSPRSSSCC